MKRSLYATAFVLQPNGVVYFRLIDAEAPPFIERSADWSRRDHDCGMLHIATLRALTGLNVGRGLRPTVWPEIGGSPENVFELNFEGGVLQSIQWAEPGPWGREVWKK